jgi:predicted RNA-binding Zn-ribbon protein involved in translation (DUF1610 family)
MNCPYCGSALVLKIGEADTPKGAGDIVQCLNCGMDGVRLNTNELHQSTER